jgi:CRP/FNR family cyclic AMP-dependent transcriptional regulator
MIKVEDLKKQVLLQGLTEEEYTKLASILELKHYDKDKTIFKEGDASEGIYLIQKGRVRISQSIPGERNRTLVIFREGNYFGDLSVLETKVHNATATTLAEADLFLFRMETLNCRAGENLLLSCHILKKLALIASKNLRQMNRKYLRLGESF